MRRLVCIGVAMLLFSSCSPMQTDAIQVPVATERPFSTSTEISDESLIATEQIKASRAKTEAALTTAAQPTSPFVPTYTLTSDNLPTLTPIANSTPAGDGAYFRVSADVLGPQYEIENACYFDTQAGWERHEIYAGAVAGSGDAYSAQGVVVVRTLRVLEQDGEMKVELVGMKEYLTSSKTGPLRLSLLRGCSRDPIFLLTTLDFAWFLEPLNDAFYAYEGIVPRARLEAGEATQVAEVGSYCWKGGCADGPAISTSSLPLVTKRSSVARLRLPLDQNPSSLMLSVMFVSPPGALQYDYLVEEKATWSYETPGREQMELGTLPLQREQDVKLFLEPGYYVLTVLVVWQGYGDVKYGFLIEVQE